MCRKSYAKIMQIECRTTSLLGCYAEMQLILCKDTLFYIRGQSIPYFNLFHPAISLVLKRSSAGRLTAVKNVSHYSEKYLPL